jgi:hypothetical protein
MECIYDVYRCKEIKNINNKDNHKGINLYKYNRLANIVIASACPDDIPTQTIVFSCMYSLIQIFKGLLILS